MMRDVGARVRHGEELLWLVPVAGATLLLLILAQAVGSIHGYSTAQGVAGYGDQLFKPLSLLASIGGLLILVPALTSRSGSPLQVALHPLRRRFGSPALVAAAVAPLLMMPLLFASYGLLKMLMPLHAPFAWDDAFAAADRALFLGRQPWVWTHGLFGSVGATVFFDRMYNFWVFLLPIATLSFALFAPRYERARFFLAFTAAWFLLGVGGAYLGSSAGPCFSALIGASSAPEFADLMAKLQAIQAGGEFQLDAVRWQGVLWEYHSQRRYALGLGISAMPSLHNAIAVLYALALLRIGKHIGTFAAIYAVLIFIGSIHLGWHYALDGIVSAGAMLGIWKLSGAYLRRSGYEAAVARTAPAPKPNTPFPALA